MKRLHSVVMFLALMMLASNAATAGEKQDLETWLTEAYGKETLHRTANMQMGGALASWLAQFGKGSYMRDEDVVEILELRHIGIRVYEFRKTPARRIPSSIRRKLAQHQWELVMNILDSGDNVHIYVRAGKNGLTGLLLLAQDADELVCITMNGRFRLKSL
ncbi:MAG: DUF4252 domain-containing protein [candidate division KSB1 bacterium]|nr:DUF4252 domain-containing protein [candidate division KSB1 bacterium]